MALAVAVIVVHPGREVTQSDPVLQGRLLLVEGITYTLFRLPSAAAAAIQWSQLMSRSMLHNLWGKSLKCNLS